MTLRLILSMGMLLFIAFEKFFLARRVLVERIGRFGIVGSATFDDFARAVA